MVMINVTARHMKITPEIKALAREKAEKLVHYFDRIKRVEIILNHDGKLYNVEMIITGTRGLTLVGKLSDRLYLVALDMVVEKMERQLTRLKEKLRNRRARNIKSKITRFMAKEELLSSVPGGLDENDWY